jgi:hypothetical protein
MILCYQQWIDYEQEGDQVQAGLWGGCCASVIIACIAIYGDHRRKNRRELDNVGFMPWSLVLVLSITTAVVLAAVAIKIPS